MRLKWVSLMCVFVLKNSIKRYLSHFKNNKRPTLAHQDDTEFHHPVPSLEVVGGSVTASGRQTLACRRVGPRLNVNPFGSQAVAAQFWQFPVHSEEKRVFYCFYCDFQEIGCELWAKHPEKKTDVDMWINFDPSHMRPDLKGWSNSPDYKQKMRNPVIFTLLGDCSAFGLDQVHQHKDKRKRKRHGQRQGQRQWQKRDIDGGRDKDKNRVTFTHLGDCSQLRLIQVPKPDEGDYRRALEDLARDAAGVCTPNRH